RRWQPDGHILSAQEVDEARRWLAAALRGYGQERPAWNTAKPRRMTPPAASSARRRSMNEDNAHRQNLILWLLSAAQFMLVLDLAIVNVALPSMQRTLGLSAEGLQWVVGGYALTFGGFLMLGGRLADVFGRRRMFVMGLVLLILATMVGGFSQSGGMLIAGRVLQGFAGALVSPAALSLLLTTFKEGRGRNRALGMWAAVAAAGASAGLISRGPAHTGVELAVHPLHQCAIG